MKSSVNVWGICGYVTAVIGAGLLGAGMGTNNWITEDYTQGLFKNCTEKACVNIGWTIEEAGTTLIATRSLLLTSSFIILIGLMIGASAFCCSSDIRIQSLLNIIAGILILFGCGTFTALTIVNNELGSNFPSNYFGYSFYMSWASGAVIIVAGGLQVRGKTSPEKQTEKTIDLTEIYEQDIELEWPRTYYLPPANPAPAYQQNQNSQHPGYSV